MVKHISVCPACGACPSVEVDEHEVRIGEAGNLVKLTPAEWNVLIAPSSVRRVAAAAARRPR